MGLTLELPGEVLERLKRRAESEGAGVESIAADAVITYLGLNDPQLKAEVHHRLARKYIREADELLAQGDYIQASEKGWGAAAQSIKAVALKRGLELRSHGELHKFVAKLAAETGEEELRRLWQSAGMLHQNFYENWLPKEMVAGNIEDVKKLMQRLEL